MKIAVVGTGSIGRRHLANLARLGIENLVAVSEHGKREELTIEDRRYDVLHSFEAALASGCTAVVIGNPSIFHLDYTRRAVDAGCHVYLEKPVSVGLEGLAELLAEVRQRKLVVAVGTQNRFNKRLEELKEQLDGGRAGLLLNVVANLGEHIADYHPGEDFRQSYTARKELGGGVLLTQIHQLDYLNWLFGPFSTVYAVGGKRSSLDIDVEDCVTYLLRSRSGASVTGHVDYLQRPKRVTLEVFGTEVSFKWDYFANSLSMTKAILGAEAEVSQKPFDRNDMFLASMRDFLSAIQNGTRPRADLEDGIAAVRLVEAIKTSYRDNVLVEI